MTSTGVVLKEHCVQRMEGLQGHQGPRETQGNTKHPRVLVQGSLLWMALWGRGGTRGTPNYLGPAQSTLGFCEPCGLFVTETTSVLGAPRLQVPAKGLQRRHLSASSILRKGQEASWPLTNKS